jgi:disulfide bond formation protein DsbB
MSKRSYRFIQNGLLLLTLCVLFSSFYFQYGAGLQPCPLCLMQRFCSLIFMMCCLMGICLTTLKRARMVALCQLLVALSGIYFALRQLWLQSLPIDEAGVCLPGLEMMIRYFPWQSVVQALLWGGSDCAEVDWVFLGLSMPGWSAIYFLIMLLVTGFVFWRLRFQLEVMQ